MTIYQILNKKFKVTDKLSEKIKIDIKWQPAFVLVCFMVFFFIFGVACIYFIDISAYTYNIICTTILGFSMGFITDLQYKMKKN